MYSLEHLPNHQHGEKGVVVLRRHWFTFLLTILLYVSLLILPLLILIVVWPQLAGVIQSPILFPLFIIIISIFYLSIITFLFHAFLDFYLDTWIITNERIISIEQKGMFSRIISEQKLYRVQDVTSEIHGFFPTLLKYGDLYIQTAGQQERFIFQNVAQPDRIVKLIHDLAHVSKKHHPESKAEFSAMA